jgi:formamidopyrimidine-DNA glycosylase
VLMDAISCGGSSINTYRSPLGDVGQFGEHFTVYGRAGESCPRCGGMIERCVIGGRGTYLCKDCQK